MTCRKTDNLSNWSGITKPEMENKPYWAASFSIFGTSTYISRYWFNITYLSLLAVVLDDPP